VAPLCVKCAKAHGKCYRCGDLPKPPRAYLEAGRKYLEDEVRRCEAKLLPLSTTLETLLANEDRADFRTRGVDALSETFATFASQYLGHQYSKKMAERLQAFVKLFDVGDDATVTPQLCARLQREIA
jgi:hypothetical protein